MQRRLAIALVFTALVTVVLVGFGILAMAQLGARARATDEVTRSLNILKSVLDSDAVPSRQLQALAPANRRNLGLDVLEPVVLSADGQIVALGRGRGSRGTSPVAGLQVSSDQIARLDAGETVLISRPGQVIGLLALPDEEFAQVGGPGNRAALLAAQPVTAVPGQTVAWFVSSSIVVLVGALLAGILLARRLVTPIRDIQGATAAIAAGHLTTRVEVGGDDELAELGRSVNAMAADLERSRALDQQFLLSVSHDLRTPLTAISGYAEALRDGAVDDPVGAGEVIGNHAARLDRLVRDLLDLAKLDANRFQLDLRPVDLRVVVGRTAAGLAPEASRHGIRIDHRPVGSERAEGDHREVATPEGGGEDATRRPVMVVADADRLAQAVGNVIDNAITFADQVVTVEVETRTEGDQRLAVVTIGDDGPGFAPDDLPFVFDRLYTGRARPRRAENPTGLGLAIVRELVGALGGAVRAGAHRSGGASIELTLPLATAPTGPATDARPDDGGRPMAPAITPAAEPPRPGAPDHPRSGPPRQPGP